MVGERVENQTGALSVNTRLPDGSFWHWHGDHMRPEFAQVALFHPHVPYLEAKRRRRLQKAHRSQILGVKSVAQKLMQPKHLPLRLVRAT